MTNTKNQTTSTGLDQDQGDAWWVVLGGGRNGKTRNKLEANRPYLAGGKWTKPFPMTFKVPNESLADEILTFRDAVKMIEAAKTEQEMVRLALTLPGSSSILESYINSERCAGFYPVLYGSECAIYTSYNDAINAVKGVDKPIWRRVPTFGRAIAYMISKGQSEKDTNLEYRSMIQKLAELDLVPEADNSSENEDVRSPPPSPTKRSSRSPTKRDSRSPTKRTSRMQTGASDDSHGTALATPARVGRRQPARDVPPTPVNPRAPSPTRFEDDIFNEMVFDVPREVPEYGITYQHVRNLRGIQSSTPYPVADMTPTPSCGTALDTYLQAHGYDLESKLVVTRACERSESMGDFVRRMVAYGLPALEANYNPLSSPMARTEHPSRLAARREATLQRRKYITRLARMPYKTRRKNHSLITKTPAEKKLIAERRAETRTKYQESLKEAREVITEKAAELNATFGIHSIKYYEEEIFQTARIIKQKRKTSGWNAFIRSELKRMNDALPEGAPRYTSSNPEAMAQISAAWRALSKEQKDALVPQLVKELDEVKEMKGLSIQNVPINAFHDVRATLGTVFEEVPHSQIQ
ncbi:hypothetical protein FKP32DRAFT_1604441 [Trametes sanguinea]|nr:hypothetical protein FKP32DRAFT_1604441 [Trametes sanguinea]